MQPKRIDDQTAQAVEWQATQRDLVGGPDLPLVPDARKPVASVRPSITARHSSFAASQPATPFEPLLDLHEAATVLGMHWKTLEAKARGHEVPAFKVGKRWRFRLSSLNSWLEHGINSNTTDHAVVTRQERCS